MIIHFQYVIYPEGGDWKICAISQGVSPLLFHKDRNPNDDSFFL